MFTSQMGRRKLGGSGIFLAQPEESGTWFCPRRLTGQRVPVWGVSSLAQPAEGLSPRCGAKRLSLWGRCEGQQAGVGSPEEDYME